MGSLPQPVRRLLATHIDSVAQLELLLHLHAERRTWRADELAARLRSSREMVETNMAGLAAAGFVKATVQAHALCFAYAPEARMASAVDRLAELYRTHRVSVIEAIFAPAPDPLSDFADAFKLRGDE